MLCSLFLVFMTVLSTIMIDLKFLTTKLKTNSNGYQYKYKI